MECEMKWNEMCSLLWYVEVTIRFGINLHECLFKTFLSWKPHKCKMISNWTRKTVLLLINNINKKNFRVEEVLFTGFLEITSFYTTPIGQIIPPVTWQKLKCHNFFWLIASRHCWSLNTPSFRNFSWILFKVESSSWSQ